MRSQYQNAAFVEHRLADVHGQFALGQLVDPVAQPLGVQIAADSGAVIGDTQDDRSSTLGVGQAGHLPRQIGRRLLVGVRSADDLGASTAAGLFLDLNLGGLDLIGWMPGSQQAQHLR